MTTPAAEPAPDARLLRRVRLQLVAWSGIAVLVVLLALGVALYLAVSSSMAATSEDLLTKRAETIAKSREPLERAALGYRLGERGSDTLAVVVGPDDELVGLEGLQLATGLPDRASIAAARLGRVDVRVGTVSAKDEVTGNLVSVPIRVASHPANRRGGLYVVQVIQSRAAEVQTLNTFLSVLGVGALLALVASLLAGAAYAGRALVPIRDALRRQREFAADASHELRTPLTIVRGNVELVRRRIPDDSTSVALLDDVDAEVTHLAALVDRSAAAGQDGFRHDPAGRDLAGPGRRGARRDAVALRARRGSRRHPGARFGAGAGHGRPGQAAAARDRAGG